MSTTAAMDREHQAAGWVADRGMIRQTASVFHAEPGDVVELRAFGPKRCTLSGYYDDLDKLAEDAALMARQASPVYFTLNRVNPALLARSANRFRRYADKTTADADIERRLWLPIDIDPQRPSGISASHEEHEAALERTAALRRFLVERLRWPEPIEADSGNGGHLVFRVDLPNDAESRRLIEHTLKALDLLFSDERVKIDTTVANAARIWKLYGTLSCKGDPTPDRPHRLARLLRVPDTIRAVPTEGLRRLASGAPEDDEPRNAQGFDLERWIKNHDIEVYREGTFGTGRKWIIRCAWNPDHTDRAAYIVQFANGAIAAGCHHNGCAGKTWHDLRDAVEPGWREARTTERAPPSDQAPPEFDIPPPKLDEEQRPRIEYRRFSAAELDKAEFRLEYLVERTLVAHQPCIIAGGKKSLKTSIIIDLSLSLAMATPFLGKLRVERAVTTGVMSGESGLATIQETARRVALAKGFRLADAGSKLIFSDCIPQLAHLHHIDALKAFIEGNELELLILDPTYLAMPGADAGNLFVQGEMLRNINELCQGVGCGLIMVHHCRKNKQFAYDPPELEDIAWAGFQEWARQWILVGRREPYMPGSGEHRLWLNVGGSAGHSAMWALDISEGIYPSRFWDVSLATAEEAFTAAKKQKEASKAAGREQQLREDRLAIFRYMQGTDPDSLTGIRAGVGISKERFARAWGTLLEDGVIVKAGEVEKANRQRYQGWKIADDQTEL